jgi:hypothetical protein
MHKHVVIYICIYAQRCIDVNVCILERGWNEAY